MNPREKIITQCVLCCLVFVCAKGISFLPNEQVQKAQATVQRQLETHYTEDDWKRFASGFCRKIKKTPLAIANAVARANSADSGCRVKNHAAGLRTCGRNRFNIGN